MGILVTGGTGYIGSHTVVELLEDGKEVIIVDNLSNSDESILEKIKEITGKECIFYKIDIRNEEEMNIVFNNHNIDAVIHFAGLKAVGESVNKPVEYYDNNVNGTLKLLQVMKRYGCKKIVFSSSATVYGTPERVPIKETDPAGVERTTNPYGTSKAMIEKILKDVEVTDKEFVCSILRYFNPVGAHESGLIGENPKGIPNNLMPYIGKVAMKELPKLNVFGNDYPTKDGTGVRDYIHVVDLAKAHLKALNYIENTKGVHIHNVGTGNGYSVLEMVEAFEKESGLGIPYEIVDRRAGDVAECYADPEKAQKELGWIANKDLSEMCKDTNRFLRKTEES